MEKVFHLRNYALTVSNHPTQREFRAPRARTALIIRRNLKSRLQSRSRHSYASNPASSAWMKKPVENERRVIMFAGILSGLAACLGPIAVGLTIFLLVIAFSR